MRSITPRLLKRFIPAYTGNTEFLEHCTGDMPSMDITMHILLNPEKSEFPGAARRQWENEIRLRQGELFR